MFRLLNMRESCNLHKCKIGKYISDIKCCYLICIRCKSYYQVLGLNSTASAKDIKSAYYELSLKFHPDKNDGCPESADKFREITEAYEVLGNPYKRKNYDQGFTSHDSQSYTQSGYYKPYYAKHRYQKPFTGKTKDFNYDEHYRQHYEKQRQDEYEYLRRRWEAEYHRRYPNRDHEEYFRKQSEYYRHRTHRDREEYYRNQYEQTNYGNFTDYSRILSTRFRILYFLLPVWTVFFIITLVTDTLNPEKLNRGPIYYKVSDENEDRQSNDVQNNN